MDALAFSPAFLPNLDVDLGWTKIPPEDKLCINI